MITNNCIELSGRWVRGMSRGLHCVQPVPRQLNPPMASNAHNPAKSPHTETSGHLSHCDNSGEKKGIEEGKQKIKRVLTLKTTA